MAPEIVLQQLRIVRQVLMDLEPFRSASIENVERDHYKVERMCEVVIMAMTDLLFHLLAERNKRPASYREAFIIAGEEGLIPQDRASRLTKAAGLRNILAHYYGKIDISILRDSIPVLLDDFSAVADFIEMRFIEKGR